MRLYYPVLTLFCLLFAPMILTAQEDSPPAPELLYRDGDHLVVLNGYTGETTQLPFEISDQDRFEWSPDGKYLLANREPDNCINLFNIDTMEWAYDELIACHVENVAFSPDGSEIAYSTRNEVSGTAWLFTIEDEVSRELYQTERDVNYNNGISQFEWSPTGKYTTFIDYHYIMGGSLNSLIVMDTETLDYITVSAFDTYYASYDPIWSEDDSWFLITLHDEYVISSTQFYTNQQGDVYLINSETGEQHRLTYTPAITEQNIHWTDDREVAFTEIIQVDHTYSLGEAMNIEEIPYDEMEQPDEVDYDRYDPYASFVFSPDQNTAYWIAETVVQPEIRTYELNVAALYSKFRDVTFSTEISDYNAHSNTIIGWRPSDYPYGIG